MTWKGYIVFFHDSVGGAKNANTAAGKDCAMQCVKNKRAHRGSSWTSSPRRLFKIHNQDIVNTDKDLGMEVTVTGHVMEDGMLHVDKISMEMKM